MGAVCDFKTLMGWDLEFYCNAQYGLQKIVFSEQVSVVGSC